MILSIGEILTDMIEGKEHNFQMFVGGAPFNVAVNVKQSGAIAGFIGRIGKDAAGNFISKAVGDYKLNYMDLQTDDIRNTTLAFVALDENGERYFTFFRHDTADFNINIKDIDFKKYKDLHIVHVGSLMLSEAKGVEFATSLVEKIKINKLLFSFDVNFRYDLYKTKEEANKAYKWFIERADILKFSSDELTDYTGESDLTKAIKKLNHKGLLLITLGSKGSMYCLDGKCNTVETIKVKPIDTTGAGDAYYGAMLAKIDEIGYENLTVENMNDASKFANIKGAKATLHKGAVCIEE